MKIKQIKFGRSFFLFLILMLVSACSSLNSLTSSTSDPQQLNLKRPSDPGSQIQEVLLNRKEFLEIYAKDDGRNKARLVKIFTRALNSEPYPEYRLFEIQPNSVYNMLKLQSADILISAENVAFATPDKFFGYINLLKSLDKGQIEIRRHDKSIVYQYSFVDLN
ncbi:MAG: hypothetical protein R3A13_11170 [Bdellovibrionota bacterium]